MISTVSTCILFKHFRDPPSHAKQALWNRLLEIFQERGFGFTRMQLETVGNKVVSTLTDTLWYLDPHHEKLKSRAISIPQMFSKFTGYYDWKRQKKKAPIVRNYVT